MNYFGKSDIGKSRTDNQDAFLSVALADGVALFAVCDGVGGASGGDVASMLCCEVFCRSMSEQLSSHLPLKKAPIPESSVKFMMTHALRHAHEAICERARADEELIDMSTTLVALLILGQTAYVLNVGDSRAYMISDDELLQITKDHSYVQDLIDHGRLDPALAATHQHRNIITRSVGYSANATPDLYKIALERKAPFFFLLCTDGLTGVLSDRDIYKALVGFGSLRSKADKLINMANAGGGGDNITVMLVTD